MEKLGCIQAGVVLFQNQLLTGVLLLFEWGKVLFKSGVAFARIQYSILLDTMLYKIHGHSKNHF